MDAALNALTRSIAVGLFGDGSGRVGYISTTGVMTASTLDTVTLYLSNANDITNFEVNDQLVFAASSAASLRSSSVTLTVSSLDRDAGTLTMSAKLGTITSIATGDSIFKYGDYTTTSDLLKVAGLQAWLPSSAPSSSSFFGVDRSADVSRLGGIRITGTGLPIPEALMKSAARLGREGASPDHCFMNYATWESLINQLGSKVLYTSSEVAGIGFPGIVVHGPNGPIKCFPDQNCPAAYAFLLTLDTWTLRSLGPAPRILDIDGMKMLRESTADAYEVRCAFFGNLSCKAPGWNAIITL